MRFASVRLLAAPKLTRQTTFICGSASRSAAIRSSLTPQWIIVSVSHRFRCAASARTSSMRSSPIASSDRSASASAVEYVRPR